MASIDLFLNSQTPVTLIDGEFAFIAANGSLSTPAADAITATGASSATVLGSVFAGGAFQAVNVDGGLFQLTVGQTGTIASANATTVDIAASTFARLTNAGLIQSNNVGVRMVALDNAAEVRVVNTGQILSRLESIFLNPVGGSARLVNHGLIDSSDNIAVTLGSSTANFTLINTGEISGDTAAVISNSSGDVAIVNTGAITGEIVFGNGRNLYDGSEGLLLSPDPFNSSMPNGPRILAFGGEDRLIGGRTAEHFDGGAGADILIGGGGDDFLVGGGDNDQITGGDGADDIDGGAGADTAFYHASGVGVDVSLASGAGFGGEAEGDTLLNIENLRGSDHDDVLTGNNAANNLFGGAGDDLLLGGGGNDVLGGGLGDDRFEGGAGVDIVTYGASTSRVIVNLVNKTFVGGHATGDRLLSGIEGVEGSAFDDLLTGSVAQDRVFGGAGDDVIKGFRGNDFLRGDAGADQFFYIAGDGADRVFDFQDNVDTLVFQGLGDAAAVFANATQNGSNVVFTFAAGQSLQVDSITIAQLANDADFI